MQAVVWIRGVTGNKHKTARSFLRAALVEKVGSKANSLKIDAVVAGLRRFYFVVKIVKNDRGIVTFSKSQRSSSWGYYQIGYVLLKDVIDDKELQKLIDNYSIMINNGNEKSTNQS